MEVFDKDGNPVEGVFTQEELDAKIKEAVEAQSAAVVPPAPETPPAPTTPDEPPAWAKGLIERIDRLDGNQQSAVVKNYTVGLDADKQKEFQANYEKLAGYDNTQDGMDRRAQDAYLLTTGQRFNSEAVDMKSVAAGFGGAGNPNSPVKPTGEQKAIQDALGITEDDVKKYGQS